VHELRAEGRLADTGGASENGDRPAFDAAVEEGVDLRDAGGELFEREIALLDVRHQRRKDPNAVVGDPVGVVTASDRRPAKLRHLYRPPVDGRVQPNRPVRDELQIAGRQVPRVLYGEHDGPAASFEKAHESDGLLAELVVVGREIAELCQWIDDHPVGLHLGHPVDDCLGEWLLLDLGRLEYVVRLVLGEGVGRRAQIEKPDGVRVEPECGGVGFEVVEILLEIDKQRCLPRVDAFLKEMEAEDGLPGAGPWIM
jgi:hypothetical protein